MTAAVMVGLSWLALVWGLEQARWRATDPLGFALIVSGVFLVLRPTLLVLGLDSPFPDEVFFYKDVDALIIRTQFPVLVWLLVMPPVARLTSRGAPPQLRLLRPPTDRQVTAALIPLGALAVLVTIPLWLRYGGPVGLTTAAKTRSLPDTWRLLRGASVAAACFGAAVGVFAPSGPRRKMIRWLGWGTWFLGAALSYSWGARDAAVAPLLLPLLKALDVPRHLSADSLRRTLRRLPLVLVGVAVLLGLSLGLRAWRDISLTGDVQSTIADRTLTRQISVSSNFTQYDAMMIVTAYSPRQLPRGGADLVVDAFVAPFPGSGRTLATPAVTVAQFTDQDRENGYPLTAAGDWLFALGLRGVVLGSVTSGVALGLLERWRRGMPADSRIASVAVLLLWGTTIAQGGVWLTTPGRVLSIGAPVIVVTVAIRVLARDRRRHDDRAPALGR